MRFRDLVEKFKKSEFENNFGRLQVAYELDCHEDITWSEDDFEIACEYLYDYYTHSEIGSAELVEKFIIAYQNEDFTIEDILDGNTEKVDESIYCLL